MFLNSGMPKDAARLARRFTGLFSDAEYVVGPSGSCVRTIREAYGDLLDGTDLQDWESLQGRVFELTEFLTGVMGIDRWPGNLTARAALHWSCHMPLEDDLQGRVEALVNSIDGLDLVGRSPSECCGFGGVFWTMWRDVSASIGRRRLETLTREGPDTLLLAEPGCMLQMRTAVEESGRDIRVMHVAEALASALKEL